MDRFHGNRHKLRIFFLFSNARKFKTSMNRVQNDKLLTNLACSSHSGKYWPSVRFCTASTSGQYSPVRPSRWVSKRLVFC